MKAKRKVTVIESSGDFNAALAESYIGQAIEARKKFDQTGDREYAFQLAKAIGTIQFYGHKEALNRLQSAGFINSHPIPRQSRGALSGTYFKLTPALQEALGIECSDVERPAYGAEEIAVSAFPILEFAGRYGE